MYLDLAGHKERLHALAVAVGQAGVVQPDAKLQRVLQRRILLIAQVDTSAMQKRQEFRLRRNQPHEFATETRTEALRKVICEMYLKRQNQKWHQFQFARALAG